MLARRSGSRVSLKKSRPTDSQWQKASQRCPGPGWKGTNRKGRGHCRNRRGGKSGSVRGTWLRRGKLKLGHHLRFGRFFIVIGGVALVGAIILPQSVFTVDETEQDIVTRFGNVNATHQDPGLHFNAPFIDKAISCFRQSRLLSTKAPTSTASSNPMPRSLARSNQNLIPVQWTFSPINLLTNSVASRPRCLATDPSV